MNVEKTVLRAASAKKFLSLTFPAPEPYLAPIILSGTVGMIYGPAGIGKTQIGLDAGFAVACGAPFLNWGAGKPHKVLYLDGEMPPHLMQARLRQVVKSTANSKVGMRNFGLITPALYPLGLPDIDTADGQAMLNPLIERADLTFIDNLSAWRATGREDADSLASMLRWLIWHRSLGRAFTLVHHANKAGQHRGSSKLKDALDWVLRLEPVEGRTAESSAAFVMHFEKMRHSFGEHLAPRQVTLESDKHGIRTWHSKRFITSEDRLSRKAAKLKEQGHSQTHIADALGVSTATISRILKRSR